MKALIYHRSIPLYLLGRVLSRLRPHRFFPGLAPLNLEEIPFSPHLKGWVTLRNLMCGICGSDLGLLRGTESMLLEPYGSFPAILGHEVVAEVVRAPPESKWRPGDRVVVEPVLSCDRRGLPPCRFCAQGNFNLCENFTSGILSAGPFAGYNRSVGGGMAEFMLAHPRQLVRIPETLPDKKAVLVDSLASALNPVLRHFPEDRDTVVIYGAGIIGQHLIRIVRALGSQARVVVIARHTFQRDLAASGGADVVLMSPSRAELGEAVGARFLPTTLGGGNIEGGADLFFDCVGSRRSMQEGLLSLRGRGTYVMLGTAGTLGPVDFSSLWFRELQLTGSSSYAMNDFRGRRVRTYEMAVELLAGNNYPSEGLLTHLYSLMDYATAFQTAFDKSRSKSVKVAIESTTLPSK